MSNLSPQLEALAQRRFKYVSLFEQYASYLRKDPIRGKEAYDRTIREWDILLKQGEKPVSHQDPEALQRVMDGICSMKPKSLDDYIKVMCAAHAMTNSIILYDMRKLTRREQGQVNMRLTDLVQQTLPPRNAFAALPFQQQPAVQKPLPRVGQKYSFQQLNDAITYQIRSIVLDDNNDCRYLIKYEEEGGIMYEEEIGSEAMLDMLGSSVLLDS